MSPRDWYEITVQPPETVIDLDAWMIHRRAVSRYHVLENGHPVNYKSRLPSRTGRSIQFLRDTLITDLQYRLGSKTLAEVFPAAVTKCRKHLVILSGYGPAYLQGSDGPSGIDWCETIHHEFLHLLLLRLKGEKVSIAFDKIGCIQAIPELGITPIIDLNLLLNFNDPILEFRKQSDYSRTSIN